MRQRIVSEYTSLVLTMFDAFKEKSFFQKKKELKKITESIQEEITQIIYTGGKYVTEEDVSELQFQILKVLQREGTLSRYDIMKQVNRSSSTVHENLIKMVQKGLIDEQMRLKDKKGRPPYFFKLKGDV